MRHRKSNITSRLGRKKGHREIMLRNLLTSFFVHEKVKTTETKAKIARSQAERLIRNIKGQSNAMNSIREAKKILFTVPATKKAIEIAERYKNIDSGYTRLTNLGARDGDAAKMVLIEFVEEKK